MKTKLLSSTKKYLEGCIVKHTTNLQTFLDNSLELSEDLDIIKKIQVELEQISKHQNQLSILENYTPLNLQDKDINEIKLQEKNFSIPPKSPSKSIWGEESQTSSETTQINSWGTNTQTPQETSTSSEELNFHLHGNPIDIKPQWVIDLESHLEE